jgi:hypothetical protein
VKGIDYSKQKVIIEPAHVRLYGVAEDDEKNSPPLYGIYPAVPRRVDKRIAISILAKAPLRHNF